MNFILFLLSASLGIILGSLYGYIFLQRTKRYLMPKQHDKPRMLSFFFSFVLSFCLTAFLLYFLFAVSGCNLFITATFFIGAFWSVVALYTKRLL